MNRGGKGRFAGILPMTESVVYLLSRSGRNCFPLQRGSSTAKSRPSEWDSWGERSGKGSRGGNDSIEESTDRGGVGEPGGPSPDSSAGFYSVPMRCGWFEP